MPTVLADRYELRARIGSGGMASVWRGFDRRLGREVAVKVLSESLAADERFRRRFEREARHIAALTHPNIVVVHDVGSDGDRLFIVMELVAGKALRQLLAESPLLPPPFVADLAGDVLAGLGRAHEAGILHRDIKPGNILVTETGLSKLADFGIAKATEETVDLTDSGAILGSVSYASPEQLSGDALGPPSDLYSFGCVLYECLAGRPPFVADNIAALVSQQQFATPDSLRELSPETPVELGDTIMRALEKDPGRRFASASEMKEAFGGVDSERRGRRSFISGKARPRTATVTVLFCDVVGSTSLQVTLGDDAADDVRRKLFGLLRSVVERHGGELVKTLGDGGMAVFPESTVDALHCALDMTRAAGDVAKGLAMRVGLSHGEVKFEEGDWFGTPVVEAARLEAAAEPGTVLAAQVVRIIVGSRGRFVFDDLPPMTLKGLPGQVRAVRVRDAKAISLPEKLSNLTGRIRVDRKPRSARFRRRAFLLTAGVLVIALGASALVASNLLAKNPSAHSHNNPNGGGLAFGRFDSTCGGGEPVPLVMDPFSTTTPFSSAVSIGPAGAIVAYNQAIEGVPQAPNQGNLFALSPNCSLNQTFFPAINQTSINALTVGPKGGIYVAGSDGAGWVIAKYLSTGALDPSFGKGGLVVHPEAAAGAQMLGNPTRIIAAGSGDVLVFGNDGGAHCCAASLLIALKPNGSLDQAFGTRGVVNADVSSGSYSQLMQQTGDGSLLVGDSYAAMGCGLFTIDEYRSSGRRVSSFHRISVTGTGTVCGGGIEIPGYSSAQLATLVTLPGNQFAAVGYELSTQSNGPPQPAPAFLIRFRRNGLVDQSFGRRGVVSLPGLAEPTTATAYGEVVYDPPTLEAIAQPDGGVVVNMIRSTGLYLVYITSTGRVGGQVRVPMPAKQPLTVAVGDAGQGRTLIVAGSTSGQWEVARYLGARP